MKTNKMHVEGQILKEQQLLHYLQKLMLDGIVFQGTFDLLFQTLLFIIQKHRFNRVSHVESDSETGPMKKWSF